MSINSSHLGFTANRGIELLLPVCGRQRHANSARITTGNGRMLFKRYNLIKYLILIQTEQKPRPNAIGLASPAAAAYPIIAEARVQKTGGALNK